MGVPMNGSGAGDMFLAVKGARAGAIEGESEDSAHPKEIEVVAWSWGMSQKRGPGESFSKGEVVGGSEAFGRAQVNELRIVKSLDTASTALMSALRHNEPITSAILTVRKAGSTPLEFLKIELGDARISSISIEGGVPPGSIGLVEVVSFTFNKINIEYTGQGKDGQKLGGRNFVDEFQTK